jgi:hypothetical protein
MREIKATSMPQLEFEPTTPVIEQAKTVCAFNLAAAVICLERKSVRNVNLCSVRDYNSM